MAVKNRSMNDILVVCRGLAGLSKFAAESRLVILLRIRQPYYAVALDLHLRLLPLSVFQHSL